MSTRKTKRGFLFCLTSDIKSRPYMAPAQHFLYKTGAMISRICMSIMWGGAVKLNACSAEWKAQKNQFVGTVVTADCSVMADTLQYLPVTHTSTHRLPHLVNDSYTWSSACCCVMRLQIVQMEDTSFYLWNGDKQEANVETVRPAVKAEQLNLLQWPGDWR